MGRKGFLGLARVWSGARIVCGVFVISVGVVALFYWWMSMVELLEDVRNCTKYCLVMLKFSH